MARLKSQMRRVLLGAVAAVALLCALPAAAQTPRAAAPAAANDARRLFIGAIGGVGAVQKVGGVLGGELGIKVTDTVDIFGEGVWMQDVVTRRRLDRAASLATYLERSQGRAASSTITAPAFYAGAGARLLFKTAGRIRPYFVAGGGMVRVTLQPVVTLAGSDITSNLPQYGVTLGSDLTGDITKPAFTGGFGVMMPQTRSYVDIGFHVTSIQTAGQVTNAVSARAAVGVRF